MANKSFGVKELSVISSNQTPTIESVTDIIVNANNVAISTNVTVGNRVGVGTTNPITSLDIRGNVYTSGIITASSFVGNVTGTATTAIGVSTTISINTSGIITASSFVGNGSGLTNIQSGQLTGALPAIDGSALTGIVGSGSGIIVKDSGTTVGTAGTIDFGDNLTVSAISAGVVTVTGSAGGGSSQWVTTDVGIHTLSNVGIGTTNPGARLNVVNNSSSDALRITQLGTGNALVVEDSANPDSTPFVVNASGSVGIGTTNITTGYKVQIHNGFLQLTNNNEGIAFNKGLLIGYSSFDNFHTISSWNLALTLTTGINAVPVVIQPINDRRVGIGSQNPNNKLDVIGSTYISDNLGVGITNPTSKLHIIGDARVGIDTSQGVILTSANGTKYRLIVSDAGALSTILVP
jgi:hypothetical protein